VLFPIMLPLPPIVSAILPDSPALIVEAAASLIALLCLCVEAYLGARRVTR